MMIKSFFIRYKIIILLIIVIGPPIVISQTSGYLENQKSSITTFNSLKSITQSAENESKYYVSKFQINLTQEFPERSFAVNSTVEYQGLLYISVKQDDEADKKKYDVEWNNDSEYTFLFNQSFSLTSNNASTDIHWTYYFSNHSLSNTKPLNFTVKLREGFNNILFTVGFHYNMHYIKKLTPETSIFIMDPRVTNAQYTLNVTQVIIIGITPDSTSNITFHVEGGYIEDNKDYVLSPNETFILFMKLRKRNESEMLEDSYGEYPFPYYSFELTNKSGSATIHYLEFQYVRDPNVPFGYHGGNISDILPMVLVLTLFSGKHLKERKIKKVDK